MTSNSKLYLIVLTSLETGLKIPQAAHAMRRFIAEFPVVEREWYDVSNNLVVLEYPDLVGLAERLEGHGMALSRFHEPDRDGQLTALCVTPLARKMLARLPLACAA